jgi:hypothetical protein
MKAYVIAPRALTKPTTSAGTPNPLFYMITDARNMGVPVNYEGDNVVIGPVTSQSELTINEVESLVSVGCEVTGYPVFAEMTAKAYKKEVPTFMPNQTYEDYSEVKEEDDTPTQGVYTWGDYPVSSRQKIGSKHYIACSSSSEYWPASLWKKVDGLAGVKIITPDEFKAKQPQEDDLEVSVAIK